MIWWKGCYMVIDWNDNGAFVGFYTGYCEIVVVFVLLQGYNIFYLMCRISTSTFDRDCFPSYKYLITLHNIPQPSSDVDARLSENYCITLATHLS